jgi:hypothetical protein
VFIYIGFVIIYRHFFANLYDYYDNIPIKYLMKRTRLSGNAENMCMEPNMYGVQL